MIWRRPERLSPPQRCAHCQLCWKEYKNGTIWCYDGCWMPLTWLGVQERIQHIASRDDRLEELDKCYGLDFKGLQEHQKEAGTSSRNLPIGTFSDSYKRRHCKHFRIAPPGHSWSDKGVEYEKMARRTARTSAATPPAMAAVIVPEPSGLSSVGSTGQRAASSSAPAETTARLTPRGSVAAMPPANPPLEGNSAASRAYRLSLMGDVTNQKIYNLTKAAKKNVGADGTPFLSHTDRWNRCLTYRSQKTRDGCPKWLIYPSGETVREDGEKGEQFPWR
jgi:hypothetical protein